MLYVMATQSISPTPPAVLEGINPQQPHCPMADPDAEPPGSQHRSSAQSKKEKQGEKLSWLLRQSQPHLSYLDLEETARIHSPGIKGGYTSKKTLGGNLN